MRGVSHQHSPIQYASAQCHYTIAEPARSDSQPGNHTGYKQFKGRKTPAEEVAELYEGLKQSRLNDFDVLLSGYCPSAGVVQQVGKIARETRFASTTKPGAFFWGTCKRLLSRETRS
jgi:hypothetical protein